MNKGSYLKVLGGFVLGVIATIIFGVVLSYKEADNFNQHKQKLSVLGMRIIDDIKAKNTDKIAADLIEYEKLIKLPYDAGKLVFIHWQQAEIFIQKGQPQKAEENYKAAINLADKNPEYVDSRIDASVRRLYSVFLDQKGEHLEAEKFAKQSYEIAVKNKDIDLQIDTLNDQSIILTNLERIEEAKTYNDKVLALYQTQIDKATRGIAWTYNNIAYDASKTKDMAKTLEYGNKALAITKDNLLKSATLNTIGEGYYFNDEYTEAEKYFIQAINIIETTDKVNRVVNDSHTGVTHKDLAKAEIKLNKFEDACKNLAIADTAYKFIGAEKDLNEDKSLKSDAHCQ